MRRPHLADLPKVELPSGYIMRDFRDGDDGAWACILAASFESERGSFDFGQMMSTCSCYQPERVKLVFSEAGEPAATASCWEDARFGAGSAILHWVGTHPHHSGRRLGHWVSLAVLHHASTLRCSPTFLRTDDLRTAALKTYLRMDFEPVCSHTSHADRWRRVLQRLDYPVDRFEHILNGPLTPL